MKRYDHYLLYMDEEKKNFIDENEDSYSGSVVKTKI